ncbi:hypothetical protein [Halopiger djelfimassiliensis]|uniref:hypothetical protein n=1 Tax=Halopiger djelfimassiliensis TaxID=1293047 RepID=UPI000678346C|nr:hypothetical protein [Halopiger djelfimassiliensis]
MTELTIPSEADAGRAAELVSDHIEIGDTVEVREADRTGGEEHTLTGEVTGLEPGYLELDGQPLDEGSIRYDEIHTVTRIESA